MSTEPTGAFTGYEGRECGEHRTTGGRAWCFDDSEWCSHAVACRGCELAGLRKRAEQAEAERDQARADAKSWHDTYQDYANAADAFLTELLEMLPGAADTGSDAHDQIPRGITNLRAEWVRLAEQVKRVRDLHAPDEHGHCKGCATHVTFTPHDRCKTLAALDGEVTP
jgi:hypothetical protein